VTVFILHEILPCSTEEEIGRDFLGCFDSFGGAATRVGIAFSDRYAYTDDADFGIVASWDARDPKSGDWRYEITEVEVQEASP
jgi:hypothetical protein